MDRDEEAEEIIRRLKRPPRHRAQLAAIWTMDILKDLEDYRGVNFDAILKEIADAIDREITEELKGTMYK